MNALLRALSWLGALLEKSWRLGAVLDFPVHVSFNLLFLLLYVAIAGDVTLMLTLVVGLASILAHELGHAVVARRLGVDCPRIELNFFGGFAHMVIPRTPGVELRIAVAGPAVSLVLGIASLGIASLASLPSLMVVGWINLAIAVFNLVPGLPMDGGRILRAVIARWYGHRAATDVAVSVSYVVAVAFFFVGLRMGWFRLLLFAPLLGLMATFERWQARRAPQGTDLTKRAA